LTEGVSFAVDLATPRRPDIPLPDGFLIVFATPTAGPCARM